MPRDSSLSGLTAERLAGFCALLCLAISALLLGKPSFSNASLPVRGIPDPVISLQASRSIQDLDWVLGEAPSPDREVMRVKQYVGFAFIAAYTALLFSLSLLLLRSGGPGRMLAPAAMILTLATAAFNIAGNLAILRILDVHLYETTPAMIKAIRSASFASWALAALTLGLLSTYFFRSPKLLSRFTGALFVLTALMQLYGLRDGQFLVYAGIPAGAALMAIAATLLPRSKRVPPSLTLLLLFGASVLRAEVKEVRTYHTHEPRDRNVLFAMAVTPDQAVLSLVAKKDGKWRLTRIRNWLDKNPVEQTIEVPGISASAQPNDSPAPLVLVSVHLLATSDGNLAIAVATGARANRSFDNIVSVIDLRTFRVLTTAHQNGNLQYFSDRADRLLAIQETSRYGSQTESRLEFLTLPGLADTHACRFSETVVNSTSIPQDLDCATILNKDAGSPGLAELLQGLVDARGLPLIRTKQLLPCPVNCSPDGRFRTRRITNFRRNWRDNGADEGRDHLGGERGDSRHCERKRPRHHRAQARRAQWQRLPPGPRRRHTVEGLRDYRTPPMNCDGLGTASHTHGVKFRVILDYDPVAQAYSVVCPELQGCASAGDTEAEARQNIEEAIRLYLAPSELDLPHDAKLIEVSVG